MTRLLLTLLVAFVPLANADYSSCILENMKGVGSDLAAKEIQQACTIKWSADKATNSSNSPLEAIDLKVEGSADPKTKIHENLIEAAAAGVINVVATRSVTGQASPENQESKNCLIVLLAQMT